MAYTPTVQYFGSGVVWRKEGFDVHQADESTTNAISPILPDSGENMEWRCFKV